MTASKNASQAGGGGSCNADGDYQLVPHEVLCSPTTTYEVILVHLCCVDVWGPLVGYQLCAYESSMNLTIILLNFRYTGILHDGLVIIDCVALHQYPILC